MERHDNLGELSIAQVMRWVDEAVTVAQRKRAVLLLDDAALTLTPPYMVEFFEVFRALKSARIAPNEGRPVFDGLLSDVCRQRAGVLHGFTLLHVRRVGGRVRTRTTVLLRRVRMCDLG